MTSALIDSPVKPLLTLRPTSGFAAVNVRELVRGRELLWTLAVRDLKLRYKQTALGVAWVILQPLVAAGILSFVFGKLAGLASDHVPYFLLSFSGQLGWNFFANIVNRTSMCLVGNTQLVSKVFFPRLILPLSIVPTALLDFLIAAGLLVGLMIWSTLHGTGVAVGPQLLLFPLFIVLFMCLALGIGLWAAALNVSYRDVGQILPVAMQMLMYASPVAYAATLVPGKYRFIYDLNPLVGLVEGMRWSVLGSTTAPSWGLLLYSTSVSIVLLVLGLLMFKRMERKFADVI